MHHFKEYLLNSTWIFPYTLLLNVTETESMHYAHLYVYGICRAQYCAIGMSSRCFFIYLSPITMKNEKHPYDTRRKIYIYLGFEFWILNICILMALSKNPRIIIILSAVHIFKLKFFWLRVQPAYYLNTQYECGVWRIIFCSVFRVQTSNPRRETRWNMKL